MNVLIQDDDTHLGEAWEPTEKQFAAYLARELQLASSNCELLAKTHGMQAVRAANTLHTKHTFLLGFQALLASRGTR